MWQSSRSWVPQGWTRREGIKIVNLQSLSEVCAKQGTREWTIDMKHSLTKNEINLWKHNEKDWWMRRLFKYYLIIYSFIDICAFNNNKFSSNYVVCQSPGDVDLWSHYMGRSTSGLATSPICWQSTYCHGPLDIPCDGSCCPGCRHCECSTRPELTQVSWTRRLGPRQRWFSLRQWHPSSRSWPWPGEVPHCARTRSIWGCPGYCHRSPCVSIWSHRDHSSWSDNSHLCDVSDSKLNHSEMIFLISVYCLVYIN